MNIAATQYNLNKRALEIYTSGCYFHCKGCHNQELWDFNIGEKLDDNKFVEIVVKINENYSMISEVWFLGGEPLHQGQELYHLAMGLYEFFPDKKYVLFTGYDLQELKDFHPSVFNLFDEIKFGRYNEDMRTDGGELASSNQGFWRKES